MRQFDYLFEELPLVVIGEIEAALVTGEAMITYDRDGYWEIADIWFSGYRDGKPCSAAAPKVLYDMILERLTGHWRDKVQEAVSEQIETDRIIDEDDYADHRRERMKDDL